jgi:two-component system, chemotaxis family, chemotaxis protein CheY
MPVMDGVELTRRMLLGNHSRRIPVVVVSAEPNPQKIDQLRKLGIRGHIKKPFTPEMVRDVLTGLLTEVNRAA